MTEKYASRVGLPGTMTALKLKIKNTEYDRNTLAVAINLIEFQNLNFLYPKKEELFSWEFPRYLVTGYEFDFNTWRLFMTKIFSADYSTRLVSEA